MVNSYDIGSTVRVTCTFKVDGVVTDPSTVALSVKNPAGVITTYTLTAAQVIRDGTGVYHFDIDANADGPWRYRFTSTGAAKAACESKFLVKGAFV